MASRLKVSFSAFLSLALFFVSFADGVGSAGPLRLAADSCPCIGCAEVACCQEDQPKPADPIAAPTSASGASYNGVILLPDRICVVELSPLRIDCLISNVHQPLTGEAPLFKRQCRYLI